MLPKHQLKNSRCSNGSRLPGNRGMAWGHGGGGTRLNAILGLSSGFHHDILYYHKLVHKHERVNTHPVVVHVNFRLQGYYNWCRIMFCFPVHDVHE